jgi:superfamily II DNA or RNA helicase
MDDRSAFFCVRGNDLDRLTKDDLKAIANWLQGAAFTPKRKDRKPYQSEAIKVLLANLERHNRVTAVMACGTGKTLMALWLAEDLKAKRHFGAGTIVDARPADSARMVERDILGAA